MLDIEAFSHEPAVSNLRSQKKSSDSRVSGRIAPNQRFAGSGSGPVLRNRTHTSPNKGVNTKPEDSQSTEGIRCADTSSHMTNRKCESFIKL